MTALDVEWLRCKREQHRSKRRSAIAMLCIEACAGKVEMCFYTGLLPSAVSACCSLSSFLPEEDDEVVTVRYDNKRR
ncbi:hypothetical protein QE152_g30053 [Popillia japonica]|uniref:Uncharacterized protein n=1 Tax=Popillia japonica TaxID=7064 RepID=A0AAW1JFE7_POPJA